jgi:hypothetical protein
MRPKRSRNRTQSPTIPRPALAGSRGSPRRAPRFNLDVAADQFRTGRRCWPSSRLCWIDGVGPRTRDARAGVVSVNVLQVDDGVARVAVPDLHVDRTAVQLCKGIVFRVTGLRVHSSFRVLTTHGTVFYLGVAEGELRHGSVASSPAIDGVPVVSKLFLRGLQKWKAYQYS